MSNLNPGGGAGTPGPTGATGPTGPAGADLLLTPSVQAVLDGITDGKVAAQHTVDAAGFAPHHEVFVNVRAAPYNAAGDGVTDDSAAINAAITANPGRTIHLPAGPGGSAIYAVTSTTGILLNQPGTRLLLDPGTTVKMLTNAATTYKALKVSATDCTIEGGTFLGDSPTHTGSTGEWGHLVVIDGGSDRCRVLNVTARNAWGDGFTIQNNPADVSVVNCIADDNRRQGMSVTSATRLRVLGGIYKNTGLTAFTSPGAGIDIEPNPSSGLNVIDATIVGVTISGNKGNGIVLVGATAQMTSVSVSSCRAVGNGLGATACGYVVIGAAGTISARLIGCLASGNTNDGFQVAAPGITLAACEASANTNMGFRISGVAAKLISPVSHDNMQHGIQLNAGSDNSTITGGESSGNSQQTNGGYVNVDFQAATNTRVVGHVSDAGTNTNKPANGFLIRTGAVTRLIACDVRGTFTVSNVNDVPGTTVMLPVPGAALPATFTATNIQTFTAGGTWTKPAGAVAHDIICIGPASGGGSGARGPAGTALSGGGGGGGGALSTLSCPSVALTATVTVTVGAGGAGAVGQTTDGTAGTVGSAGVTATTFGGYLSAGRSPTGGGGGGLAVAGTAGAVANGMFAGGPGGGGSATGAVGATAVNTVAPTGGGGGGGITTASVAANGGVAGSGTAQPSLAGTAGVTPGGNGGAGNSAVGQIGSGGGGGAGNATGVGGTGGNGGSYGAGGGGGGASLNGSASGAGGNGGSGVAIVITYF